MKIKTFKLDRYRTCPIYYRNFQDHFEYLTIVKGDLYTAHLTVNPKWITKLLFLLKIESTPYSQQHTKIVIKQLRMMAETTVDFILDKQS